MRTVLKQRSGVSAFMKSGRRIQTFWASHLLLNLREKTVFAVYLLRNTIEGLSAQTTYVLFYAVLRFFSDLSEVLHVNCNSIEKHCPVSFFCQFVFYIREITYANNCVFHCIHKEIDNAFFPGANYLFCESGLKITLRLLSSSLGNSSFAYVISQIRNTNRQKKYWTMFFNQIAIHMQNF